MMAMPFDTLKIVEQLEKAGCTLEQAKAHASVLLEVMSDEEVRMADKFASKANFTQVGADAFTLRQEMKTMISDAKAEIVRWVVGVGMLQMALITGLVLKLVH